MGGGETYRDLVIGFAVGAITGHRHLREGLDVFAALAPTLERAAAAAPRKVFVVLDGTLLRIGRLDAHAIADPAGRPIRVRRPAGFSFTGSTWVGSAAAPPDRTYFDTTWNSRLSWSLVLSSDDTGSVPM